MQAAIYARYSTANQDARSIEDQERRCRALATAKGLDVVEVYSDEAVSGSHLRREGLQRLLADAKAKRFKVVIVDDLSRLSRDRVDSGVLVRDLKDCRVQVLDVETGLSSDEDAADMVFGVKALIGGEYIKTIRKQTHRGLEGRALAGFHTGGKAYGYTTVPEPSPADPKNPRHVPVIDEDEAKVVRRVFKEFVAGASPRDIAHQLNADEVPAPHDGGRGFKDGKGWGFTTIRAMLLNERYVGEVVWNKYKWTKTARGTRQRDPRPEREWVRQSKPELAIVERRLFDRAQARFTKNTKTGTGQARHRAPQKARHVLTGLLTCGVCGGNFGVVHTRRHAGGVWRTLGCVAHKDRGDAICANGYTISDRKVARALVDHLRQRMSAPDRVKKFVAAFQRKFEELEAKGEDPRAQLHAKIDRQRKTVHGLTEALTNNPTSKALGERLVAEERALGDLEAQLHAAPAPRSKVIPHPAAIAKYVEHLAELLEAGDLVRAGEVLRSALAPFRLIPREGGGYRMTGALNVGLTEKGSSGGVI